MSMTMIKAFLYAISALVVGAFFTIWTVQRSRELAVMRAMGASTGFLMLDGLMQALIVLLSSVGAGVLLGLGLGAMLLGTGMPFALEASPIIGGAVLLTVVALDHVHLRVRPRELVAIVGPSGAGKSSLLAVAGGLTQPTEGEVNVNGIDVRSLSKRELAKFRRDNIGFVFQSGNLIPALTAIDQLRLVAKIGGSKHSADPAVLLEAVGMSHRANRRPGQLSGGERQRVGIARALMSNPSVLLVDEPTASLDQARSREVVELLAGRTHESEVATVMVTHDHNVLEHCDRIVEMIDGRLTER
jgi:putative ABC transport system ATP-binding protein